MTSTAQQQSRQRRPIQDKPFSKRLVNVFCLANRFIFYCALLNETILGYNS